VLHVTITMSCQSIVSPQCYMSQSPCLVSLLSHPSVTCHNHHVLSVWREDTSWLITRFVTRVTRVSLVEQELLTFMEHLSSSLVFSGVHITRSLVFCVVFCRSWFVLLSFFFCPLCCLSSDLRILMTPLISSDKWHPSCYSSYKPGGKSWIRKGSESVYDEWNISVGICYTDVP
jgi:hypothetical protein